MEKVVFDRLRNKITEILYAINSEYPEVIKGFSDFYKESRSDYDESESSCSEDIDENKYYYFDRMRDTFNKIDWIDYADVYNGSYRCCWIIKSQSEPLFDDWVIKLSTSDYYDGSDCCQIEEHLYNMAIVDGVEDSFAETICLGTLVIDGHTLGPFYAARRYDVDTERVLDMYDEAYYNENYKIQEVSQRYCEYISNHSGGDAGISECFAGYYQDEIQYLEELEDFLCRYDIRDLHDGNIGFSRDGRPVIIDYSFV